MSGHFEAKKIAWRQTKDGLVLALAIHPDDVSPEMALAALNTRFMIAFSEIGDDEKPVSKPLLVQAERSEGGSPKPFSTLPLSQQAGIRSTDKDFARFIFDLPKGSMCINIERDEDIIPEWIRTLCGVESRSQLIAGTKAGDAWLALEAKFQTWLTDQKYAEARR